MRIIFLIFITFFLNTSCKKKLLREVRAADLVPVFVKNKNLPDRQYDPRLVIFLNQFVTDAKERGIIIPDYTLDKLRIIRYVDQFDSNLGNGVIAACSRYSTYETVWGAQHELLWMKIEVLEKKSEDFVDGSIRRLQELIYHELFHCLLNKGHLPDGYNGIMQPVLYQGSTRADKNWPALVDDLFSPEYIHLIENAM